MLWSLLAVFLGIMIFSGSGGDATPFGELTTQYVKGQIKTTIADKERRKAALQGLSAVNDDIDDINKQISKDVKAIEKLIKNYDSTPEDFDRLFASVLATRERQEDRLWDDRRVMLKHVQADEWQMIIDGAKVEMEKAAAKKAKK
jgi:hypothetical protein